MRTKMTHTPGPWVIQGGIEKKPHDFYPILGPKSESIAAVLTENHANAPRPEGASNASLIAAAPDLLEAAKRALGEFIVNGHPGERGMCGIEIADGCAICEAAKDIRAAIAKAEGRDGAA